MRFCAVLLTTLSAVATGFAQEMSLTGGDGTYSPHVLMGFGA